MSTADAPSLQPGDLTGPQRAAVLVMYLQREVAREVLRHLSDADLNGIGEAMAEVENVTPEVIEDIVGQFIRDMYDACLVPTTGTEYALDVLPDLLEAKRRPKMMSHLRRQLSNRLAEAVGDHEPRTVAAVLLDEHPQTRAVALLLMGEDHAAAVLGEFPEEIRSEIALRMARMERVPAGLADKVEESLIAALEDDSAVGRITVEGVDKTAKILGRLNMDQQQSVLDGIARGEPELSEMLRRRMVVFDDLAGLDDRGMQTVLKSIERDKLVIALRGASDVITDLVLRNMSSRAAKDLAEEIEILGPKPRAVVEQAREEIVQTVLHLREEGAVTLSFGGDNEMM